MNRRRFAALAAGLALAATGRAAPARRVEVVAKRFAFEPDEITVARGTALTLAVTSVDFVHGLSIPDFGIRRDLPPGRVVEVTFTPAKPGRFHYLCDNFCGDGHDRMSGLLVVT